MRGFVIALGLLCGCRQVFGFDDVVAPPGAIDAPVDQAQTAIDTPIDTPPPIGEVRKIEIVDAKVTGGPHTDFPLLVAISDPALRSVTNGGKVANDAGFDIVFTPDQAGTSRLAHEMDAYDPVNGNVLAWVKVPSLTADTVVFVHYGDPAVTTSQESVPAVWSASYAGVWHLTTLDDSTGKNSTATQANTTVVAGKLAGARDFNGVDSHIDVAASGAIADVFVGGATIEAWVNPQSAGENQLGRVVDKAGTWLLGRGDTLVNNSLLFSEDFSTAAANWRSPQGSFQKGKQIHVAAIYDSTSTANVPRMFIDGIEVAPGAQSPAGTRPTDATAVLVIGNQIEGDRTWDGVIDEVKLSTTMRSPDWIATEVANQGDPTTFLMISPPL